MNEGRRKGITRSADKSEKRKEGRRATGKVKIGVMQQIKNENGNKSGLE